MKNFLFAAFCLLGIVGCAAEDPGTWYPKFQATSRVQVDPSVKYHKDLPGELKSVVEDTANKYNLAIYAVVAREGDRGEDTAGKLQRRMLHKWKNDRSFPLDTYVVVVWLADRDNAGHGTMAIAVGEHVMRMGVSSTQLDEVCKGAGDLNPAKAIASALNKLSEQIEAKKTDNSISWGVIAVLVVIGLIFVIGLVAAAASGNSMMLVWFIIIFSGGGSSGSSGGGSW